MQIKEVIKLQNYFELNTPFVTICSWQVSRGIDRLNFQVCAAALLVVLELYSQCVDADFLLYKQVQNRIPSCELTAGCSQSHGGKVYFVTLYFIHYYLMLLYYKCMHTYLYISCVLKLYLNTYSDNTLQVFIWYNWNYCCMLLIGIMVIVI